VVRGSARILASTRATVRTTFTSSAVYDRRAAPWPESALTQPEISFLWRRICALGVAQIISWGTLFYTIAVLGAAMRNDLGVSDVLLFGAYTAGLFVSGLMSPFVGRRIDRHGGRPMLASGSVLGAVACAVLALAQGPLTLLAGWLLAGLAMAGCLYDPAFATLHAIAGARYRRAVTALTLFGGFASTVFWPLSQFLLEAVGWRATFLIYAGLHVVVCLPAHLVAVPAGRGPGASFDERAPPDDASQPMTARPDGAVYVWLATALSLAAFLASAMAAHLIGLLTATGLAARDAVLIGSLIGPMQVAGRIMEFAFSRHVRALAVGMLAFGTMAVALALLTQVRGVWIVGLAFAIPYGWSNGLMTIARGTVPAELFGTRGYGALLGRLALPQFVLRAIAPVALTLLFVVDPSRMLTPYVLVFLALIAFVAYRAALRHARA
jgi:predicted MFS family arabinose efflux permease